MRSIRLSKLFPLLFVMALTASADTQDRQPAQPQAEPVAPGTVIVASKEDYRIGPRDVLEIRVQNAEELSTIYTINADGTFMMPYLGRIQGKDKTPAELARYITEGLRGRYLKNPQVSVAVKQFNSHTFFIQGAVRRPGVYQIEGRPSLLRLISLAGGLGDNTGSNAFIIREEQAVKDRAAARDATINPGADNSQTPDASASPAAEEVEYSVKTVNIAGLYKGRLDQNVYLEPGDIVNIPPADVFYVAGEVNAPGQYPLSEGTTLRQAMALAQGTTFNAASGRGSIFRVDPNTGKREEIKVDIGAVMKNKKEDLEILANDIVMVPSSKGKTIGNAILKAFGLGAAQRGPVPYR